MSTFRSRDSAAQIGQNLRGGDFLAVEFNRKVVGIAAHGIGGVKGAGGIDKKARARKFAMLIGRRESLRRLWRLLENLL